MQRSRSPASSYCTAFERDSSNCEVSAFKIKLHLQSGTQCFEPEPALRSKDCLLVLVICTRAGKSTSDRVRRGYQVFCVRRNRETLYMVEGITHHGTGDQRRGHRRITARLPLA